LNGGHSTFGAWFGHTHKLICLLDLNNLLSKQAHYNPYYLFDIIQLLHIVFVIFVWLGTAG